MTPEEIRAEAAQRVAKAEHARLYPGMPWEKVCAEDLVWLLEEAAAVVDALGDMLPTEIEEDWFKCAGPGPVVTHARRYVTAWREVTE